MEWKNCKIRIEKNSTDLYHTFRSMGVIANSVLVAVYQTSGNKIVYSVLALDDERAIGIIGGNELYTWNNDVIVGYCPVEAVPETWFNSLGKPKKTASGNDFKGVIYQNGTMFKGYDNADELFEDYDALMEIQRSNNGEPVFTEYDNREGSAVFYNPDTHKPSSISYKTNRQR